MKNQWRCCCVTQKPSKTHTTSPCATSKDQEMKISWDPQRPAIGPLEDTIAMLATSRVVWKRISWLQHIAAYFDMDIVDIPGTRYVDIFVAVPFRPNTVWFGSNSTRWTWCRRFFGFMAALMSLMYSPAYSRPSGLPTQGLQETSISLQILLKSVQSCLPFANGIERKWYSIHSRLSSIAEIPATKKTFLAASSNWVPCQVNLPRPCIRLPSHCPWHSELSHVSDSASVFPFSEHKYFETKYSTWFNKCEETKLCQSMPILQKYYAIASEIRICFFGIPWNRPASTTPRSDVHLPRCRSQCRGCRCSWTAENVVVSKCLDNMD